MRQLGCILLVACACGGRIAVLPDAGSNVCSDAILATSQNEGAASIAGDGKSVYWVNQLTNGDFLLERYDQTGTSELFSAGKIGIGPVAVGGGSVFFVTGGAVDAIPTSGGPVIEVMPLDVGESVVALATTPAALLVLVEATASRLLRIGTDGVVHVLKDGIAMPVAMASDETSAYVIASNEMWSVDVTSGVGTTLATGLRGHTLAVDGDSVYVDDTDSSLLSWSLRAIPKAGGSATTLLTTSQYEFPTAMAADATGIYVTAVQAPNFSHENGFSWLLRFNPAAPELGLREISSDPGVAYNGIQLLGGGVYWTIGKGGASPLDGPSVRKLCEPTEP